MTIRKLIKHHKDMLNWQMSDEERKVHVDAIEFLESLIELIDVLFKQIKPLKKGVE